MEKDYKEMWKCLDRFFGYMADNADSAEKMLAYYTLQLLMQSVENLGVSIIEKRMMEHE